MILVTVFSNELRVFGKHARIYGKDSVIFVLLASQDYRSE